jgi:glycerol-3-phosphate dehydrogenase (NAD(P)+)
MNITVIGAGAWGTALAISLAGQHRVTLWARDAEQIAAMRSTRCNRRYLPDAQLPDNLALSSDFAAALNDAELVILAVPTVALRLTLQKLVSCFPLSNSEETTSHSTKPAGGQVAGYLLQAGDETNEKRGKQAIREADARKNIVKFPGVVWLCKGFEAQTSLLPHQVAADVLPSGMHCGVLSGPSFALEVAQGLPTALVLASDDEAFAQRVAHALHHFRLRVYASNDVIGVEVGGAVKNVMAIAAGVCDGMKLGNNARAALMTRGLVEITRLGLKLGGCQETLSGLSGAGDLILTCTGDLSRNRRVGLLLAENQTLEEILSQLGHVAEGVYAVREVYRLAQRLGVEMPISEAVYRVLYEHVPTSEMVAILLNRTASLEFG